MMSLAFSGILFFRRFSLKWEKLLSSFSVDDVLIVDPAVGIDFFELLVAGSTVR